MPTQQVPREQWTDYLSAFSGRNQTRPVNVDIESKEFGDQRLVDHRPFLGLEASFKDQESYITVIAGDPQGGDPAALTHEVQKPSAVWVKENDQGQDEALDIEAEDGRIIIQFV